MLNLIHPSSPFAGQLCCHSPSENETNCNVLFCIWASSFIIPFLKGNKYGCASCQMSNQIRIMQYLSDYQINATWLHGETVCVALVMCPNSTRTTKLTNISTMLLKWEAVHTIHNNWYTKLWINVKWHSLLSFITITVLGLQSTTAEHCHVSLT